MCADFSYDPVTATDEASATGQTADLAKPNWPVLAPLLAQDNIPGTTWTMIRHVNALGAEGLASHMATLWRHLAHWPVLFAQVHSAFSPLQSCDQWFRNTR